MMATAGRASSVPRGISREAGFMGSEPCMAELMTDVPGMGAGGGAGGLGGRQPGHHSSISSTRPPLLPSPAALVVNGTATTTVTTTSAPTPPVTPGSVVGLVGGGRSGGGLSSVRDRGGGGMGTGGTGGRHLANIKLPPSGGDNSNTGVGPTPLGPTLSHQQQPQSTGGSHPGGVKLQEYAWMKEKKPSRKNAAPTHVGNGGGMCGGSLPHGTGSMLTHLPVESPGQHPGQVGRSTGNQHTSPGAINGLGNMYFFVRILFA